MCTASSTSYRGEASIYFYYSECPDITAIHTPHPPSKLLNSRRRFRTTRDNEGWELKSFMCITTTKDPLATAFFIFIFSPSGKLQSRVFQPCHSHRHTRVLSQRCIQWLLPRVDSQVSFQVFMTCESFATNWTIEWFLSSVNSRVSPQTSLLGKSFSTFGTTERFVPRMQSHVFGQVTRDAESRFTNRAFERFFSCMNSHVWGQTWVLREA